MTDRVFLDTGILVYALAQDDPRSDIATRLLAAGGVVSVQVLNEFAAVASGKMGMEWPDVAQALNRIKILCEDVVPLTLAMHEEALRLAARYGFAFHDAVIAAAARRSKCAVLYSEDFQNGLVIEGSLTVRDPFAE
jgi:predicted nucleic acid-binding protein